MLQLNASRRDGVAVATATGHHGEILQGAFRDRDGRLHRGLVTLGFPYVRSMAVAESSPQLGISMGTDGRSKALRAAQLLIGSEGVQGYGVRLRLISNIPIGHGLGSSTADVVAAINACAKLLGRDLSADRILRLAVEAETASDGTMFRGRARLVAHREGRVIETFATRLPAFGLVSVNVAPDSPVDTLVYKPARYNDDELSEFSDLLTRLRQGIGTGDAELVGEVATRSAQINDGFLPQPKFAELLDIARQSRALGIQVAHSGRVVGLMLPVRFGEHRLRRLLGAIRDLELLPTYYPHLS